MFSINLTLMGAICRSSMNTDTKIALEQARLAAKRGDRARARNILREIVKRDPTNEQVYLLFAKVAQKREHSIQCYQRVLEINPYNPIALKALEKVQNAEGAQVSQRLFQREARKPATTDESDHVRDRKSPFKVAFFRTIAFLTIMALAVAGAIFYLKQVNRAEETQEEEPPLSSEALFPITEAESEDADSKLKTEFIGRIRIEEGNPTEYEPAWNRIGLISFQPVAEPSQDKPSHWYELDITLYTEFQFQHSVKFRVDFENQVTGESGSALAKNEILPSQSLDLYTEEERDEKLYFYYWYPEAGADTPSTGLRVTDVEIARIDGLLENEWSPPEPGQIYYRDIWVISNTTPDTIPLYWEYRKYDTQGVLISSEEYNFCMQSSGDYRSLFREASFLNPGESFVTSTDLSIAEVESGIETELATQDLSECRLAADFGIRPNPQVKLMDFERQEDRITIWVKNESQKEAFGLLYITTYDEQGYPIDGQIAEIDSDGLPIPPEAEVELQTTIKLLQWINPIPAQYKIVFLGLSE
jgi:tetratricopeptide (TPR) repeat protein